MADEKDEAPEGASEDEAAPEDQASEGAEGDDADDEDVSDGDEEEDGDDEDDKAKRPKIARKKLIIIAAAAVLALVVVGGGVAFFLLGDGDEAGTATVQLAGPPVFHDLPGVIADLKTGRCRSPYLKIQIVLEIPGEQVPVVKEKETQIMDAVQAQHPDQHRPSSLVVGVFFFEPERLRGSMGGDKRAATGCATGDGMNEG